MMNDERIRWIQSSSFLCTLNITNNHKLLNHFLSSEPAGDSKIDGPLLLIQFEFNFIIIKYFKKKSFFSVSHGYFLHDFYLLN